MKVTKILGLFTILLLSVLALSSVASALPLVIEEVQVDDIVVTETNVNRLALERGKEFEVEVRFTPTEDIDDMEIEGSGTFSVDEIRDQIEALRRVLGKV